MWILVKFWVVNVVVVTVLTWEICCLLGSGCWWWCCRGGGGGHLAGSLGCHTSDLADRLAHKSTFLPAIKAATNT